MSTLDFKLAAFDYKGQTKPVTVRDVVQGLRDQKLTIQSVEECVRAKLPFDTLTEEYSLEYGKAAIQIHADAIASGARVLLVDDVIATGGTMLASVRLLERLGAAAILPAAIIDLPELGGSKALVNKGLRPFTLCAFDGH